MSKEILFVGALSSISFNKLASFGVITIALLSAVLCIDPVNSAESQPRLLEVKIYYETLCPYCQRFVRNQFYEAMLEKNLFNYTDIIFIPYGKVKISKDPETGEEYLKCQHGLRECELNALDACIVENNSKMEQLQMFRCLKGGDTVENCSDVLQIDVNAALRCKSSRSIEDILKKYGEETDAVGLKYVPAIAFDGVFDLNEQDSILHDFVSAFCEKYKQKYNETPENCSG